MNKTGVGTKCFLSNQENVTVCIGWQKRRIGMNLCWSFKDADDNQIWTICWQHGGDQSIKCIRHKRHSLFSRYLHCILSQELHSLVPIILTFISENSESHARNDETSLFLSSSYSKMFVLFGQLLYIKCCFMERSYITGSSGYFAL